MAMGWVCPKIRPMSRYGPVCGRERHKNRPPVAAPGARAKKHSTQYTQYYTISNRK